MKTLAIATLLLLFVAPVALADLVESFGNGVLQFNMEFVTVGNPGNAADTTGNPNPAGAVSYVYNMAKYEVSEDMITKANVLGTLGITFDLRGSLKPATSVSWNEAARFVNWLNTSEGFSPAYKFTTQPGNMGYNPNENVSLWTAGDAGFKAANPFRNGQAYYFLPSADEWYKAAYHDATAGTAGTYFNYPTGSNSTPDGFDSFVDPNFDAVFRDDPAVVFQPNDITNVGVLSPYGTAGQGGNVFEWEETEFDLVNDSGSSNRAYRGGFWGSTVGSLLVSARGSDDPTNGFNFIGFRVASVASIPEPSPLLYGALITALGVLWCRLAG